MPAPDTTGAGRALINDINLTVISPTGAEYHGNQFTNGWSDSGLAGYDTVNNIENVYIEIPELGKYTIIVNGSDIRQDALLATPAFDQDYAMVVSGIFDLGNPYNITILNPAGTWPIWKFISFPIGVNGPITTILDDSLHPWSDGGFTWDIAQWYDATNLTGNNWKSYNKNFVGTQQLLTINNTMGVWLRLTGNTGDQYLTTGIGGGDPQSVSIQLVAGWNMVGYPSNAPEQVQNTLPDWGNTVTKIAYYDDAAPYDMIETTDGTYLMTEGNAFWVYSTVAQPWIL